MKIIFMGTSDFAVPTLEELNNSKHQLLAVICRPPAKSGRGHKLTPSPVQVRAEELGLNVLYPKSLRKEEAQNTIREIGADIIVVVAYGNILPKEVLEICKYGCLNIHPSTLPRWRGAAPVERTILAGDSMTSVCVMQMDEGLDTGDILMQKDIAVNEGATSASLREITAKIGADILIKTLENHSNIIPQKQTEAGATYADKLEKSEGRIVWSDSVEVIDRKIRAFTPWPGSFFEYKGEQIKITEARCLKQEASQQPGTVIDDKLTIACSGGVVQPLILQRPGKKPMYLKELLNGFKITKGICLD